MTDTADPGRLARPDALGFASAVIGVVASLAILPADIGLAIYLSEKFLGAPYKSSAYSHITWAYFGAISILTLLMAVSAALALVLTAERDERTPLASLAAVARAIGAALLALAGLELIFLLVALIVLVV
jgi:hypothetical protein